MNHSRYPTHGPIRRIPLSLNGDVMIPVDDKDVFVVIGSDGSFVQDTIIPFHSYDPIHHIAVHEGCVPCPMTTSGKSGIKIGRASHTERFLLCNGCGRMFFLFPVTITTFGELYSFVRQPGVLKKRGAFEEANALCHKGIAILRRWASSV